MVAPQNTSASEISGGYDVTTKKKSPSFCRRVRRAPLDEDASSRCDTISSSSDSVLVHLSNELHLKKENGGTRNNNHKIVCLHDDCFLAAEGGEEDDTIASVDAVSSSGSSGGEHSFPCDSSEGSAPSEMSSQDMIACSAPQHNIYPEHDEVTGDNKEVEETAGDTAAAAATTESKPAPSEASFAALRWSYLLVTLVVMLADGLQGTHLYVLYESYGFSVASLYCLGFFTGALMSPVTGPLIDKIGRRRAAMLYCVLEILINQLEQYPYLVGLVASRMIGGFTTNLLHSVFETWLDTEYRRQGFAKEKYEVIMRDSIIVSNLSAIVSGYLSHILADHYGAVGPFRGAVGCTAVALVVIGAVWTENYGSKDPLSKDSNDRKGMLEFLKEATDAFKDDPKMLRVGIIQGLSSGALHIFIFLWAPMLITLAHDAPKDSWGLDSNGEPAFGLIFGAFMGAGVIGGLAAPPIRKVVSVLLSPRSESDNDAVETEIMGEGTVPIRPMAVEFLAACCYLVGAVMLLVPCLVSGPDAFSHVLTVFLVYEFTVGVFYPCEGVIRSLYFPESARASIMAFPSIIVNVAVSLGVISTNFISLTTAFAAISFVMLLSTVLQLSLITMREWSSLFARAERSSRYARSVSFSAYDSIRMSSSKAMRRLSSSALPSDPSRGGEDAASSIDNQLHQVSLLLKMKGE